MVRVEDSSQAALSCAGAEGRGGNPTFELRSAGKSARHREVLGNRIYLELSILGCKSPVKLGTGLKAVGAVAVYFSLEAWEGAR